MKKLIITLWAALAFTGCVQQTSIDRPAVQAVTHGRWQNMQLDCDIFYSQPEAARLSATEKQPPLTPFAEELSMFDERSVATYLAIRKFPELLLQQLPPNCSLGSDTDFDVKVIVEMEAHSHKGPVYPGHESGESLVKGLVTFGITPAQRELIADFKLTYRLRDAQGREFFTKSFEVADRLDHVGYKGLFGTDGSRGNSSKLLERYLVTTLHEVLAESAPTPQQR